MCDQWIPLIVIPKKTGELRICGYYKSTINTYLKDFNYPIPTADEIIKRLNGGKYLFKLDLRSVYNQIPLERNQRNVALRARMLAFFLVRRMPFGIKPASVIFQCEIEKRISGIKFATTYATNALGGLTGKNKVKRQHLQVPQEKFQVPTKYINSS